MTKLQLEAQIAALQAELAASRCAANVETEPLNDDASMNNILGMFGMLGISWKKVIAKCVVGGGYGYLVTSLLASTLVAIGTPTWPVLLAVMAHITALALCIYIIMISSGVVADFVVDTVPAHAVSAYHATTRWLSGAARTTQSFASEQFARVVH